jgi:pimeloyl-ACP methyl ester carboxylesterase
VVATLVLVHGAWHGSWCWERVTPLLADAGTPYVAVDLPGRDLYDDSGAVLTALDQLPGSAVLVGHSYGGAVVTDAGDHPAVASLVYLAALALDVGESCGSAAASDPDAAAIVHEGRPDLLADAVIEDGLIALDPANARLCLYDECEPDVAEWAVQQLRPHGAASLGQEVRSAAWRTKPSTYAVCERDLGLHPDLQRLLAKRSDRTVSWPTDHSPFLSAPERVAELLVAAAASA